MSVLSIVLAFFSPDEVQNGPYGLNGQRARTRFDKPILLICISSLAIYSYPSLVIGLCLLDWRRLYDWDKMYRLHARPNEYCIRTADRTATYLDNGRPTLCLLRTFDSFTSTRVTYMFLVETTSSLRSLQDLFLSFFCALPIDSTYYRVAHIYPNGA